MSDVVLVEFQKEYYSLNNKFLKAHKDLFELGVVAVYTSEIEKGFIVKKQLKTTSSGTKFNYKMVESKEEIEIYSKMVKDMYNRLAPDLLAKRVNELVELAGR